MLLNKQGKQVNVHHEMNSRTHPHIFANLREVKEPATHVGVKMFSLKERAKYVE